MLIRAIDSRRLCGLRSTLCAVLTLAVTLVGSTASAQHLYLSPVQFPGQQMWPMAISVDGSVVVGHFGVHPTTNYTTAGLWRPESGTFANVVPEYLQGYRSSATGVSENGEVIAGNLKLTQAPPFDNSWKNEVFIKTPGGFGLANPFVLEPEIRAAPSGCVSADGRFIAGSGSWFIYDPISPFYSNLTFNMGPSGWYEMIRNSPTSAANPAAISAGGQHMAGTATTANVGSGAWRWGPGIDETYMFGDGCWASAISGDGAVIAVNIRYNGSNGHPEDVVVLISDAATVTLSNPAPAVRNIMNCTAMSADAQTVCGDWWNTDTLNAEPIDGWIWTAGHAVASSREYFSTVHGLDMSGFRTLKITGISMDGMVFGGYGLQTDGRLRAFVIDLRKDTDGDGLYDHWETDGVPFIGFGGAVERLMLPGADPLRKDIYVEIDAMAGLTPSIVALQSVAAAFDLAPVPAPDVPGGQPGINLHTDVTDVNLPLQLAPMNIATYSAYKNAYFGTPSERQSGAAEMRLKKKREIYRYCLFAHQLPGGMIGVAECVHDVGTFGERLGADDMMIGLGAATLSQGRTIEDLQASAFMHELGHTLGLWHGGASAVQNYNPNHYSVMNYLWAGRRYFGPLAPTSNLHLDYSRSSPHVLDEFNLYEFEGIGGNENIRVPIVTRASITASLCGDPPTNHGVCLRTNEANIPYTCVNYVPFNGPVDWNNDRIIAQEIPVCADPNGLTERTPGQTLAGCNEWALIAYSFRNGPLSHGEFLLGPTDEKCMTEAEDMFLNSLPAAPPADPCTGVPPNVFPPTPPTAASCGDQTVKFTVDFAGAGPGYARWRWWNPMLQTPGWVNFTDGPMPGGTVVKGSGDSTLTLEHPRIADLGGAVVLISCRITDACGVSADSPTCTLVMGELSASMASPANAGTCPGGSAHFAVSASAQNGPIIYEWVALMSQTLVFSNGPMASGTVVQGASTASLTLSNVSASDFDGAWTMLACRVSNACGMVEVGPFYFSSTGIGIIEHPQLLALECDDAPSQVVFAANAVAAPPVTYQWMKNGAPLANGGRISGANSLTLTIASPIGSDSAYYKCEISGACGSATTDIATFYYGPPRLEVDPPRFTPACVGSPAILSIVPLGSLFSDVQWMKDGLDLVEGGRYSGTTNWSLRINDIGPADFASMYAVRLQNACGTFVSQPRTLPEFQPIVFAQQPQSRVVCPSGSVVLNAVPALDQDTFPFWQMEDPTSPGSWGGLDDGPLPYPAQECGSVSGAYSQTLRVAFTASHDCPVALRFRCALYANCGSGESDAAVVTICRADVNCSGCLSFQDIFDFLNTWFAGHSSADFNGVGGLSVQDIFDMLTAWFSGCG